MSSTVRARRFTRTLKRTGVFLVNDYTTASVVGSPLVRKKKLAATEASARVQELIDERRG